MKWYILFLILFVSKVHAQAIVAVKDSIDFGTIALSDNSNSYELVVRRTGEVSRDPQIILFSTPSPAEYSLTGFPSFTPLYVNIVPVDTETSKVIGTNAIEQFTISDFEYLPIITSDATGSATITIGAKLTTSGVNYYNDGVYNLIYSLEVNY